MGCGCGGSTPKNAGPARAGQKPPEQRPVGPTAPTYFWNGPQRRGAKQPKKK